MNKETKDQIGNAAQQHADNCIFSPYDNHRGIARASYIAGAETWADRGEVLVELLAKIRDRLPAKDQFGREITEALSNYNNPVK